MTPERLEAVREHLETTGYSHAFKPQAFELLEEVDRLTAELAAARAAWDEWKASSRAGHSHASDMAAENARLREGIERVRGHVHESWLHQGDARLIEDALDECDTLLNPTEGES